MVTSGKIADYVGLSDNCARLDINISTDNKESKRVGKSRLVVLSDVCVARPLILNA